MTCTRTVACSPSRSRAPAPHASARQRGSRRPPRRRRASSRSGTTSRSRSCRTASCSSSRTQVTLSPELRARLGDTVVFSLHAGLSPERVGPARRSPRRRAAPPRAAGLDDGGEEAAPRAGRVLRRDARAGRAPLHRPLRRQGLPPRRGPRRGVRAEVERAARASSRRMARCSPASTRWLPELSDDLVAFTLEAHVPAGWDVVSQGARTRHERDADADAVRWESPEPQDEVFLVAGPVRGARAPQPGASSSRPSCARTTPPSRTRYLAAGDGVPLDVRAAPRAVPVREVRARRELLGDGLRDAVLHAARAEDHPPPVHPALELPARDPPQLVGQRRVRRPRARQLVRGAHRVPRGPPRPGAGRPGRRLPPHRRCSATRTTSRRTGTSPCASSARGTTRSRRRSATTRCSWCSTCSASGWATSGSWRRCGASTRSSGSAPRRSRTWRRAMSAAAGEDLAWFFAEWVDRPGAPAIRLESAEVVTRGGSHALELTLAQTQDGEPYAVDVPVYLTAAVFAAGGEADGAPRRAAPALHARRSTRRPRASTWIPSTTCSAAWTRRSCRPR